MNKALYQVPPKVEAIIGKNISEVEALLNQTTQSCQLQTSLEGRLIDEHSAIKPVHGCYCTRDSACYLERPSLRGRHKQSAHQQQISSKEDCPVYQTALRIVEKLKSMRCC